MSVESDFDTTTQGTWGEAARRIVHAIYLLFSSDAPPASPAIGDIKNQFNNLYAFYQNNPGLPLYGHAALLGANTLAAATNEFREHFPGEDEIVETLCRKQSDYGPENVVRFGEMGILVRLHDKIARLENLKTKAGALRPLNETILDNWQDLIGYCAILAMFAAGEFTLPLTVAESNEEALPIPQG